jgi:hypothetical protein
MVIEFWISECLTDNYQQKDQKNTLGMKEIMALLKKHR